MISRFAVHVIPRSELLEGSIQWKVSWRIDDVRQSNKTLKGAMLADVFSTETLAATAGRRASMEQLDLMIREAERNSKQPYVDPEDDED
ncbi:MULTISPECIES: hypothetical protein [Xanthomonas]|nr:MULTISPECIES: hypothetical protein [Xanthomonas]